MFQYVQLTSCGYRNLKSIWKKISIEEVVMACLPIHPPLGGFIMITNNINFEYVVGKIRVK